MKTFNYTLAALLATTALSSFAKPNLTLYTTSWSMYGKTPYEYDGAYQNGQPYGQLRYVSNPEMVTQFNKADVVAWSFLQVWNSSNPDQQHYPIPASWDGLMHFDDLWAELPLEGDWINPLPPETKDFLTFCKANVGACSSVQLNGNSGQKELFHYTDQRGVGQLNSFGAFIHSNKYTAKRIIAVGGANTPANKGISTYTFDAIFKNQDKFLTQFKQWMQHFKNIEGIDYDFEPPMDMQTGGQLPADERTIADYNKLFQLIKASRAKLGEKAYISVTITVNKEYLEKINQSVDNGWFKQVSQYVDSINLMTYDLHGPWDKSADPYTSIHAWLKQPNSNHKDEFVVNYATDEITEQALSYGVPKNKLQIGIASYGRGFAGVEVGTDAEHPGFEQPWQKACVFNETYSPQDGLVPYNSINKIVNELGYKKYHVQVEMDNQPVMSGAYIYSPEAKQFIGYQSPEVVKAVCNYVKNKQLQGAIMWSADTDLPVSNPDSLVASYRSGC